MAGKLIIFSAPSGAGKTTIVRHILKENFNLEFSISACSRPKRPNEKDGIDYYFIPADEFKRRIKNNEFIEWEEVYEGSFYGTLKSEIQRIAGKGHNVLFDVDVIGGINIKRMYAEKAISVFVMPPSIEALKQRLVNRHTDDAESLNTRIAKAEKEITYASQFDKIIVNDTLETAVNEAKEIVRQFLNIP
ncbi:MAG: guanylate kinase [Bacteroidia bacterium]|nr:guanylate kinase [Bacteroidia bacterium]